MARPATRASRPSVSDRPSVRRPRAPVVGAPASAPSVIQQTDKTVREVIPPWHVIQKKMAEKEVEKKKAAEAAENEEKKEERAPLSTITPPPPAPEALLALSAFEDVAPSSGVRLSEPPPPFDDVAPPSVEGEPGLSFKVYTLAELERRSDAPMALSMRASRVAFDGTLSRSSQHWVRVKNAVVTFAKAAYAWWKTSKMEREPAKIALRQPFDEMGDELEFVVRSVDWKRAGVHTGIAVGASLTLLFGVLIAAELTDDLHTNAKARMNMQSTSAVNPPPLAAAPLPPAPVVIAPPAPPAAPEETVEIDPPAKKAAAAKKPAAAPAKKKLAYRNADDVFKP